MLLKKLSLLGDKNLNKAAIENLERSSKTRTLNLSLLTSVGISFTSFIEIFWLQSVKKFQYF